MSANIYNKGIFRNIYRCDPVVTTQQKNNLRLIDLLLEIQTEFQSVDLSLVSMQNIETVPAGGGIDDVIVYR